MSDSDDCDTKAPIMALSRKRAALKAVITKHFNYFNGLDADASIPKVQLLVKEERLRSAFERYENVNLEICAIDPDSDDLDAVESRFLDTLAKIKLLADFNKQPLPSQAHSLSRQHQKLPEISVPPFAGKYSEYRPFIDLFNALVHNNSVLENVQKLIYLRSFLRDEPLDLIKNLPIVGDSYLEACKLLKSRYDNLYKITNEHINSLLDLTPISKSTANNIRSFVSIVKQQLAALQNLNYNVAQWDPVVLCILTRKLDALCNREFQLLRETEPTVNSLIEFLEKRALALENAEKPVLSLAPRALAHMAIVRRDAGVNSKKSAPPPQVCILCATAA